MKSKAEIFSISLLLLVFIMLVSFGGHKAEWKSKIEKIDGITVKQNEGVIFGLIFQLDNFELR